LIAAARANPSPKHPSPIANLIRIFKVRKAKLEKILPTAQCPPQIARFSTKVRSSREDSIKFEKSDPADFKVFSDGSGLNGDVGAAAALYRKGRYSTVNTLKYFLGPSSKHNTFEAEAVGAILATKLLSDCPDTIGKRVSLYIDNQSILASLGNPKATSGQYLIRHLFILANALACNLNIHWISSHSKVRGNEKVDELAKEAANGTSSEGNRLPQILRDRLPASASAAKQAFHGKLKAKWEDSWVESERGIRFATIDDDFPFNSFRKRAHSLNRSQASLMTQIRSGHFPLNSYLFKINKVESDLCQACLEGEDNRQCRETVKHFLFECNAYTAEREDLIVKIPRRHLNLKDIMSRTDRMVALAHFINRTGRLKKEQPP
jgi:ribonuclease HI